MRTIAVMKRTLLDLLSDAHDRKTLARSAEAAKAPAETIGEIDPASPRCQTGLHDHIRRDWWLITVTEFTSRSLPFTICLAKI